MKHPYHDYSTEDALNLARNCIHGPIPKKDDPTPTVDEAIAVLQERRRTCGFIWITGRVAVEVLRATRGEKDPFY